MLFASFGGERQEEQRRGKGEEEERKCATGEVLKIFPLANQISPYLFDALSLAMPLVHQGPAKSVSCLTFSFICVRGH